MENIIILIVLNAIFAFFFVAGAVRSAAGYVRLVLAVAVAAVAVAVIAFVTGETRVGHSASSQAAAGLAMAALASTLTVAIATVRFLIAAVAALVAVINCRNVEGYLAAARKAEATRPWSSFPAWCRAEALKHEAAAKAAARWLYRD